MKEELVTFETAKLAKEKGFDYTCSCGYDENGEVYRPHYWEMSCDTNTLSIKESDLDEDVICLAPTQSLLQRWLREVHGKLVYANHFKEDWYEYHIQHNEVVDSHGKVWVDVVVSLTNELSYEEVLEKGLQEAVRLI